MHDERTFGHPVDVRWWALPLAGIVVGAIVYLATDGHVLFLPLLLVVPFVFSFGRRGR
jgi:hypothetical protein